MHKNSRPALPKISLLAFASARSKLHECHNFEINTATCTNQMWPRHLAGSRACSASSTTSSLMCVTMSPTCSSCAQLLSECNALSLCVTGLTFPVQQSRLNAMTSNPKMGRVTHWHEVKRVAIWWTELYLDCDANATLRLLLLLLGPEDGGEDGGVERRVSRQVTERACEQKKQLLALRQQIWQHLQRAITF